VFPSGSCGRFRCKVPRARVRSPMEKHAVADDESTRRNAKRSSPGANVSATRAGYLQLLGMERRERAERRGEARALPARRGSNDDLYPLLPVLLPTRDNTNHYHRLITGITANIEIMRVYACTRAHQRASRGYTCARARARARTLRRARSLALSARLTHSCRPAEDTAPSLISSSPPTLSPVLSLSLLFHPARHGIQRRCRHHLRDTGRGVSVGQVRCEPAPDEARSVRRR